MRESTFKYVRLRKMPHIWCPGCGHGIIMGALVRTFERMKIHRENLCCVSGIGCSSRTPGYLDACTLHTTHGRGLAFATGIKHARPDMRVVAVMGDGDATAIGGNHFIHAARRNIDITAIVFNNNVYGMTGGQYSPTTPVDAITTTAPYGHVEQAFHISELAKGAGATYVARTTVYHVGQMEQLMEEALTRSGFSVVEVLCYCHTTFGRRQKGSQRKRTGWEYLKWFKENTIPIKAAAKLPPEKTVGKILTGVVHDDSSREEYTSLYSLIEDRSSKFAPRLKEEDVDSDQTVWDPPRREHTEVILSGAGGQGLLLAGVVLAEAASKHSALYAVQTQSYGPEARGGASKSEVVIDTTTVNYPKVRQADVVLALTDESFLAYVSRARPGALVVADEAVRTESIDEAGGDLRVVRLPIVATARRVVGRTQTTNIVALGALNTYARLLAHEALEAAVLGRVPAGTEEMNRAALAAGRDLALGEGDAPGDREE